MLCAELLLAQVPDIYFVYFTEENTHIKTRFTHAAKDPFGNICLATSGAGVAIYDGYEFNYLTHHPSDSSSIVANSILSIHPAPDGHMYIGTTLGFSKVDMENLQVENFSPNFDQESEIPISHYTEFILSDSNQDLWIGSTDKLTLFDPEKKKPRAVFQPKSLGKNSKNLCIRLLQDEQDEYLIWIGSDLGLRSFDKKRKTFDHHPNPPKWHNITLYVENGASQDLGFFLLVQKFFKDQPISVREAVVRKLYADWLKATKPGKHFRKETFEVATSIRVLLNELNQSSSNAVIC